MNYKLIPHEIWVYIFGFLDSESLTKTALASSLFLGIARPILYQAVFLGNTHDDATKTTLNLLISNLDLAHSVKFIHLHTTAKAEGLSECWIDPDILVGMSRLVSIALTGTFSWQTNTAKQERFSSALKTFCPLLQELVLFQHIPPDIVDFPGFQLDIIGLKNIFWTVEGTDSVDIMLPVSLLRGSIQTLQTLHLASGLDILDWSLGQSSFFLLRFPLLHTFTIGPWTDLIDPEPGREPGMLMVQFLAAHPLITYLALNFDALDPWAMQLPEAHIKPDLLPNLHTIHCLANTVSIMLRFGVHSMSQLVSLSVGAITGDEIDEWLLTMKKTGGLPRLEELRFEMGDYTSELDTVREWISMLADTCPILECWYTQSYETANIFERYPALVEILSPSPQSTGFLRDWSSRVAVLCTAIS